MTTLTPSEIHALHFAVRADRQARSHTRIVSAVEEIVAAHLAAQAESVCDVLGGAS